MPKKGKKMLDYSIFFDKEHHKYINNQFYLNKKKIHLTITFKKSAPSGLHIHNLIRFLHSQNLDFKFFSWTCRAKRREEQKINSHKVGREHAHIIIYSKEDINSLIDAYFYQISEYYEHIEQYHIGEIYEIEGLIQYLHNGHHKIYQSIYKIKNKFNSITSYNSEFIQNSYKLDEILKIQEVNSEETKKSEPEIKISLSLFFVKFKIKKITYSYKFNKYLNST